MNFKSIILSILLLTLLAACGSAPTTPPAPPTSLPTPIIASAQLQPEATTAPTAPLKAASPTSPAATRELKPTATMHLTPLPSSEPLLLYPTGRGLKVAREDGSPIKSIHTMLVPSLSRNLRAGIKPDEMSVAIYSGDNPLTPDRESDEPLSLYLQHVPTGNFKLLTSLFSPELDQALQTATATGDRTAEVEAAIAVIENDHTLAWSPNGRYLAFIAAVDGPSSDVYSYDRETGQINRLTDGLNQAARLFWSPDSQWIIHEEVESFGTGAGWNVKAVWAAAPDGSGNRKLYDTELSGDEVFVEWVTPDTFIVYAWTPIGLQNVRLFNLSQEEAQRIGPEFPVQAYAVEPSSQTQLYVVDDYTARENNMQGGLYLDSSAQPPQRVAPGNWYEVRWLPQAQLFFAQGESGVISVALDGTLHEYSGENALPIDSPDGAWLLAWGDGNFTSPIGLRLYTTDGELIRTLTPEAVTFATWSPDATGVFYVSDGQLYYVAIPNGEPQLVEEDLLSTDAGSIGWVRP